MTGFEPGFSSDGSDMLCQLCDNEGQFQTKNTNGPLGLFYKSLRLQKLWIPNLRAVNFDRYFLHASNGSIS